MSRRRRSYEAGHKPKWLVVIDDTPECDRAIYFAARRAARVGAGVVMLRVIETADRNQQWLGVADIMKAEAHEEADAALDDSNVDRFCTLLEDIAKSTGTRFLVITHHRMTMSRMDRLYGVTMVERGISQLVAVDLREAERLTRA